MRLISIAAAVAVAFAADDSLEHRPKGVKWFLSEESITCAITCTPFGGCDWDAFAIYSPADADGIRVNQSSVACAKGTDETLTKCNSIDTSQS